MVPLKSLTFSFQGKNNNNSILQSHESAKMIAMLTCNNYANKEGKRALWIL